MVLGCDINAGNIKTTVMNKKFHASLQSMGLYIMNNSMVLYEVPIFARKLTNKLSFWILIQY